MQQVNGVPVLSSDPSLLYEGLDEEPTWFSAQGGVYKCIERSTNKQVAIKKYLVEEDSIHQDMFVMPKELVENEIYSMTKCVHPNILKLIAVHLHLEFVYLIMPLCTGGSLQQYVFDHHLTVGQLVHIITSIASGLAKVHGHGYIHRDIKCDNIFLDQENNNIVIGDFGVVSISPAADSSVEEAGVVLFWSPELVQQKIVNHKVDIWALGIVILEVLNGGKAPYEDEKLDEEEIKQRILDIGRPAYPPNLPKRLVDLLDRCLDPDPRTRSSANQILQHSFLKDYQSELLFPATRLDVEIEEAVLEEEKEQVFVQEPEEIIIEKEEEDNLMQDIEQQQTNERIIKAPVSTKCRLPLPSFSVDKSISASIPVNEKIANVIRKRQSLSDTNRSQGSRIPMLCILQPVIEEEVKQPSKLRHVKSVKLTSSAKEQQLQVKRPASSHSKLNIDTSNSKMSQKRSLPRSPLTDVKSNIRKPKTTTKKELPPKSSIYRHKRLPAGESRTARLMMGVSTNGRRQSFRSRGESSEEELLPTLGANSSKLFNKTSPLPQPTLTTYKRRPMSFAASSSSLPKYVPDNRENLVTSPRSKRQSVPAKTKQSSNTTNNSKNIKAPLRVH